MIRSARVRRLALTILLAAVAAGSGMPARASVLAQGPTDDHCAGTHQDVSPALTDLGVAAYVRMDGEVTAYTGGLYPEGANSLPPDHLAAGVALARAIVPLDADGQASAAGKVALLAIGMSNTAVEFREFRDRVRLDGEVNRQVVAVSGAAAGQVAEHWVDLNAPNWTHILARLRHEQLTPLQVQAAWVKLTRTGVGDFPEQAQALQADLAAVARNLLSHFPNLKQVYFSSRTRAYAYWAGLSPEPAAFETGFAVKWLIEAQLNGDPDLNYDPARGPVVAPWLAWGPYLWADGLNPRSDGLVWTLDDVRRDCTHPSSSGIAKVADMLLSYFKTAPTTRGWFLAAPGTPAAEATPRPTATPPPVPPDERAEIVCLLHRSICAR